MELNFTYPENTGLSEKVNCADLKLAALGGWLNTGKVYKLDFLPG